MTAPILLIAIGNESRGDDALGPALVRRIQPWLSTEGSEQHMEVLEDFQLQIEHIIDLRGRKLVLFIDAGMGTSPPYAFDRVRPDETPIMFTHALGPGAVLGTYMLVYGQNPPPAWALCVRGEQFELGKPLSPQAEAHLERAAEFAQDLLRNPAELAWDERSCAARAGPSRDGHAQIPTREQPS